MLFYGLENIGNGIKDTADIIFVDILQRTSSVIQTLTPRTLHRLLFNISAEKNNFGNIVKDASYHLSFLNIDNIVVYRLNAGIVLTDY